MTADAKTIIVTGAAGFIGSHCANAFARDGWAVIGVDRRRPAPDATVQPNCTAFETDELASADRIGEMLRRHRSQALIHAAGPASVEQSFDDPRGDFLGQVGPWTAVLEAIRLNSPQTRVVLCSSAAVYGNPAMLPVAESAPAAPISPYGWHKVVKEQLLRQYVALHGIRGSSARIFSTFGPGLGQLAVWDIARKVLKGELRLQGTGQETRDYLYIGDVARAIECIALCAPGWGEAINVASGVETRIGELARMISAHLGKPDAQFQGDQTSIAGKPTRWRADVGALTGLGFVPSMPMATALATTLDWIKAREW